MAHTHAHIAPRFPQTNPLYPPMPSTHAILLNVLPRNTHTHTLPPKVNLTSANPVPLRPGAQLEFTYSVDWHETDTPFHRRFDRYLDYDFFEHQIHWVSAGGKSRVPALSAAQRRDALMPAAVFRRCPPADWGSNSVLKEKRRPLEGHHLHPPHVPCPCPPPPAPLPPCPSPPPSSPSSTLS
jgi:hypothetical protein